MPQNLIFLGIHFIVAKCKLSIILVNISHLDTDEAVHANSLLATWVTSPMRCLRLQFKLVLQSQCQKANPERKATHSYKPSIYANRLSAELWARTWIFDHTTGISGEIHRHCRRMISCISHNYKYSLMLGNRQRTNMEIRCVALPCTLNMTVLTVVGASKSRGGDR